MVTGSVVTGSVVTGSVMCERPRGKGVCAIAARILLVVVAAAALAGCDRCGDWWRPIKFEACRDEAPRPPQ